MTKRKLAITVIICLMMAIVSQTAFAAQKPDKKPAPKPKKVMPIPTADELKLIEAAIPSVLPATPKKHRKLLVFSESFGFKHTARHFGEEMLKLIAKKTNAFSVTINNNPKEYTADYLKNFDAIVNLNATGIESGFKSPGLRKDFLDFVKNGGGMIGIHAATDAGKHRWPEYSEMFGGAFGGHPWGAKGTWTVKITDPKSPINASFAGKGFDIKDELYRVRDVYKETFTEGKIHTLCEIDMSVKNNTSTPNGKLRFVHSYAARKPGVPKPEPVAMNIKRSHPLAWVKKYGNGRVFYSTFGHNHEVFWNPKIVSHYIAGIQYALGDLKVDDTNDK